MADEKAAQAGTFTDLLDTAIDQMIERGEKPKLIRLTKEAWAALDAEMCEVFDRKLYAFSYRDIPITSGEASQVESE